MAYLTAKHCDTILHVLSIAVNLLAKKFSFILCLYRGMICTYLLTYSMEQSPS